MASRRIYMIPCMHLSESVQFALFALSNAAPISPKGVSYKAQALDRNFASEVLLPRGGVVKDWRVTGSKLMNIGANNAIFSVFGMHQISFRAKPRSAGKKSSKLWFYQQDEVHTQSRRSQGRQAEHLESHHDTKRRKHNSTQNAAVDIPLEIPGAGAPSFRMERIDLLTIKLPPKDLGPGPLRGRSRSAVAKSNFGSTHIPAWLSIQALLFTQAFTKALTIAATELRNTSCTTLGKKIYEKIEVPNLIEVASKELLKSAGLKTTHTKPEKLQSTITFCKRTITPSEDAIPWWLVGRRFKRVFDTQKMITSSTDGIYRYLQLQSDVGPTTWNLWAVDGADDPDQLCTIDGADIYQRRIRVGYGNRVGHLHAEAVESGRHLVRTLGVVDRNPGK
ncbi:hypothetical protein B0J14DRAFT_558097 [Halenospora varia]|nr:hypothetical protein B0J14DRAFT_558097 [Halenospora varia]